MKLYHFCSKKHINSIQSEGLTRGTIPLFDENSQPVSLIKGFQWLTSNPAWHQEWDSESHLPYARNDYRITVAIPKSHRPKLAKWDAIESGAEELQRSQEILNSFGDPENWYVYAGRIKPGWFRGIDPHPDRQLNENP